jgi:hypothetical protein
VFGEYWRYGKYRNRNLNSKLKITGLVRVAIMDASKLSFMLNYCVLMNVATWTLLEQSTSCIIVSRCSCISYISKEDMAVQIVNGWELQSSFVVSG